MRADSAVSESRSSPTAVLWPAGPIAGVVTVGLAELLAGLPDRTGAVGGTSSPVDAVGGAFIDLIPGWVKDAAIAAFGVHDKVALYVSMTVVLIALSIGVGLLATRSVMKALVLMAALDVVALVAVWSRPHSGLLTLAPMLAGGLAGLWALSWWTSLRRRAARAQPPVPASDATTSPEPRTAAVAEAGRDSGTQVTSDNPAMPTRRAALGAGAGLMVLGAIGVVAGRVMAGGAKAVNDVRSALVLPKALRRVSVPAGADLGIAGVTPYIVPNAEFYRIDTALTVPRIDPATWTLKVTGMVEREITLDWATLLTKPMQEAMVTLMCVSNEVGGNLNGNAIWTGWPVRELLKEAGVTAGADMVLSTSVDGFTAGTPLSAMTDDRNSLIAIAQNGEPLLPEHGFPVRLVVPGLYGYVSATKWLTELKVTTFAADQGYWTPRGWSAEGPVKTQSRIDVPRDRAVVEPGTVAVAGVAWAQHRGVRAVQVQIDGGQWQDAELGTEANTDVWRQWVYRWQATSGAHTIAVRAIDSTGAPQTAALAPVAPDGATGHHTINVVVR